MYKFEAKKRESNQKEKELLLPKIFEFLNSKEKPTSRDKMYAGGCGWTRENDQDTPRAHKWKLDDYVDSRIHLPKKGKIIIRCEKCHFDKQIQVPNKFRKKYVKLFPINVIA